jgi:putative endonuclease
MTDTFKTGADGEALAAALLLSKGFKILERNYRYKRSEIDIIILKKSIVLKESLLIFVEVKTRTHISYGYPEEYVDRHQKKMIFRGALEYMRRKKWQGRVRYDIVSVVTSNTGNDIFHIEDAFY